jgi:dTDP-4-amino-4,6-dideoxygalactose transaminase
VPARRDYTAPARQVFNIYLFFYIHRSEGKRMINVTKTNLPELEKYVEYLERIWSTRWITNNGEFVQLLNRQLEKYLKIKNLVLISNGTLALQLALRVLDLKGEVITTPFTFVTTTNVILWNGLTPVFADIDAKTFNIDPADVEKKITKKTSGILAVHLYGNPCYVEELQEIADKYGLKLIYDAAHAFSVEYKNQAVCNYGDISVLSFHATKAFHSIEGGAIVARSEELVEKLKLLRNHGIKSEEEVVLPGTNAKMNEFQAIMGLCNLEKIDEKIQLRKKIYEHYKKKLRDTNYLNYQKIIASKYNYIYMPVCFKNMKKRDHVYSELLKNGIKPRKYFYPLTVNTNYFKKKGINLVEKYNLKEASNISDRILCLPLYPDLEIPIVDRIINIINRLL